MGIQGIRSYSQGYGTPAKTGVASTVGANRNSVPETGNRPESTNSKAITLPEDKITLSGKIPVAEGDDPNQVTISDEEKAPKPGEKTTKDGKSLEEPQIKQQVDRLKQIEVKVKAHEAAHKAVGGNLASSATYSYTQGPDGRSYITGGEVQIDMSGGKTPEETISRMQQVIRAALAPSDPSGQDRAVAAQAGSIMAQAQQQKARAASPTAEPDPGEPVDPAKEAIRKATSPDADNEKDRSGDANTAQAKRAYGNPAVQRVNSNTETAIRSPGDSGRQPVFPSSSRNSLISSFA